MASPRTMPSARASNGRSESVDDMGRLEAFIARKTSSWPSATPHTSARSHSPARSARTARWRAVSDDAHAVSTARDGPRASRRYESRLARIVSELPAPLEASIGPSSQVPIADASQSMA